MNKPMCPFSAPLLTEDFTCRHAEPVIRRGGTEIACRSESSCIRCIELHRSMKVAALADLGYEDDLTRVPHSVLVRIQYGGLLGLQRISAETTEPAAGVTDIDGLVETALLRFGSLSGIPCTELCADITAYKLPGRRGRNR